MLDRIRKGVAIVVSLALAFYNIWAGYFGYPNPLVHRSLNLLFLFVLVFLLFPLDYRGPAGSACRLLDFAWAALAIVVFLYPVLYAAEIEQRMPMVTSLTPAHWALGLGAIVLVIEGSRRTVGNVFVAVVLAFFAYTVWGASIPGLFKHRGFSLAETIEALYMGYNGIFGLPTAVYATYIILFILWGAFFERSGVGKLLLDVSQGLAGWARGGPAKIAVLSSACCGTVSGSAVANVYGTGSVTIPLMKRLGYRPEFAGAVEAAASTGGQIMPPVMGAAAFVMVEFLGIPYSRLILYAAIPACLYFLGVLAMVHFEALKLGLQGVPREQLPSVRRTLARQGYLILPLIALVAYLLMGYSPMRAALIALVTTIGLMVADRIAGWVRAASRGEGAPWRALGRVILGLGRDVFDSFQIGAKSAVDIGCATAGAGIVMAATTMTGLGLNLTALATGGGFPTVVVLLLVAMTCSALGMAVPTTPAYIMTAALAAPTLVALGVGELSAHMFVFYFATVSMVSPPVALAAYAGAQIAGANIMRTGFRAVFLASAGFIVPFMFVYGPELLLQGSVPRILWSTLTATVGVIALAAALDGWFLVAGSVLDRLCFLGGALLLIHTGLLTDALGALLLATALLVQWRRWRRARGPRPVPPESLAPARAMPSAEEPGVPLASPRANPE